MKKKDAPSITCPKCKRTSYSQGDIDHKFCVGDGCGFHADFRFKEYGDKQVGGKAELIEFIKNKDKLTEPLMMNFAQLSEQYIDRKLTPFWFSHVTSDQASTPLQNAKKLCFDNLTLMEFEEGCHINEEVSFCYPKDEPQKAVFGVAQAGGLVVLYNYDVVWFREPDGSECWARML